MSHKATHYAICAAILALPLLLPACNRADHSPSAALPSQEKQAKSPSDKALEQSPPAAGTPAASEPMSAVPPAIPAVPPAGKSPDESKKEPGKAY